MVPAWNEIFPVKKIIVSADDICGLVQEKCNSSALAMKDVTPLLMHWSYVFLALTHWCAVSCREENQHVVYLNPN